MNENSGTSRAENIEIHLEAKQNEETTHRKEKNTPKQVGPLELFRFSDSLDKILMVIGSVCALAHGAAVPLLIIVFGDMTDLFVGSGKLSTAVDQILAFLHRLPNGTFSDPIPTRKESILEPSVLRDFARNYSNDRNISSFFPDLHSAAEDGFLDQMETFAIWYSIIGVGVLLLAYGQETCWLLAAERQTHRIRKFFCNNIFRQDIGWFDTHATGELNTRLSDDINSIHNGLGDKMGGLFKRLSTIITGFSVGFSFGWKLTLVILAVSPALCFTVFLLHRGSGSMISAELSAYAKAGAIADEVLSSIRTVVAFGGQDKEFLRYSKNLEEAKMFGIKKNLKSGLAFGLSWLVFFCAYALGFWYGGTLVQDEGDAYTIGTVLIVFYSVVVGAFSMGNIGPYIQAFSKARSAAYIVYQLIDQIPVIDISSSEGEKPSPLKGNINFINIEFTYPAREEVQVIKGLSLDIKAGQTLALAGASGCGKGTLVALLLRFYDPQYGKVLLDGHDIRDLNLRWLRQHIGIVSQEPTLFATSIKENIQYGCKDATDKEIKAAAMMANAHDFIMDLPDKYDTLVGERGTQLSGGQKQRIAIARALVKDPKILILDEATSALDTQSESVVKEALNKAKTGRTTFIVAHRLSTIKTADVIAVLQNGAIVEHGTHNELLENGVVYKHLMQQQTMAAIQEGTDKAENNTLIAHTMVSSHYISVQPDNCIGRNEEDQSIKKTTKKLAIFVRIMKLNAPEWPFILFGCLCAVFSGGVHPAFAVIFTEILGVFAEQDQEKRKEEVDLYCLVLFFIGIVSFVSMLGQSFLFGVSGERLTLRIRQLMFRAMINQEMAWFDDPNNFTGVLTTRLAADATLVQNTTGVTLGILVQSLANIGTALILAFISGWKLTLVILGFLPIMIIASAIQMNITSGVAGSNKNALEAAGKIFTETISNIQTVTGLSIEKKMYTMYVQSLEKPYKSAMKKAHCVGISFSISQGVFFFAYAVSFYFGATLIRNDELSYKDVFRVYAPIIFGAMALGEAIAFAPDASKATEAAGNILKFVDMEAMIDSVSSATAKIESEKFLGKVNFENVKFFYPIRKNVHVLQGLNLTIDPGKTIALVGTSGCGKSTIVHLIERFYDVSKGAVELDDVNIKDLNLKWLRSQIGIVSQEPVLFNCSIKDNIAYGDNSRTVGIKEIIAAAIEANVHHFVENLPSGYDTNVGSKGTQLSAGQKQRVAIARALLRKPKILLLDEATSALDTESEKIVQETLDRASQGRTCIVIAHRLSTIRNADQIFVIHEGKVAENGQHSELMKLRGIYFKLNAIQDQERHS